MLCIATQNLLNSVHVVKEGRFFNAQSASNFFGITTLPSSSTPLIMQGAFIVFLPFTVIVCNGRDNIHEKIKQADIFYKM